MTTRSDCQLAVSIYPMFAYDASSGCGVASSELQADGRTLVTFDAASLKIPDLNWRTVRILGIPLPPPFNIAIHPRRLQGWVDRKTGVAELEFDSEFRFTAGIFDLIHKTPPLQVVTTLTTEAAVGVLRSGSGSRLVNGRGKLLGIARVPKTGDAFLDNFLFLPTDAFAMLSADFTFDS